MASRTVSLQSVLRTKTVTAKHVDLYRHRLHVSWVNATRYTTEMIDSETFRDWSNDQFIRQSVSVN